MAVGEMQIGPNEWVAEKFYYILLLLSYGFPLIFIFRRV